VLGLLKVALPETTMEPEGFAKTGSHQNIIKKDR
jgi:hypothetical protein